MRSDHVGITPSAEITALPADRVKAKLMRDPEAGTPTSLPWAT